MNANNKQMPPIGSVSVRVNYTTPDCSSIDSSGGTGEDSTINTRAGAEDASRTSSVAAVTKLEKLFDPSNVSPTRLGLAEGQEAVKVSDRLFHVKDVSDLLCAMSYDFASRSVSPIIYLVNSEHDGNITIMIASGRIVYLQWCP
jgi:hypothetical protein